MANNEVLRKKIEQSRVSVTSYPKLSILAATHARETAARVRSLFNTVADVRTEASAVIRAGRYLKGLPTPSVLGVLEVDGVPNSAAFHIESELVSHVIDLSLGGDPGIDSSYPERTPTAIDLAMCRRFADSALLAFDTAVRTVCRGRSIGAMRCLRFETSPQMANIAPDRSEVMIINQRVEMGESSRNGFFELVLPLSVVDPIKSELMQHYGSPSSLNSDLWDAHLRHYLRQSAMTLDAVVETQRLSLRDVSAWKVGDMLHLGARSMDELELVIQTERGRRSFAQGRLGARGSNKALKLTADPPQELLDILKV